VVLLLSFVRNRRVCRHNSGLIVVIFKRLDRKVEAFLRALQVFDIAASGQDPPAASALLLLRNLAFAHENKVHFLSSPRALPILLTAVTQAAIAGGDAATIAHQRALAGSALWALAYNDQRIVAALRAADARPRLEKRLRSLKTEGVLGRCEYRQHAEEALRKVIHLMG
jgi:hypothetical protein